jgi:hypothetical protein
VLKLGVSCFIIPLLAISNGFAEQKQLSVRTLAIEGEDLPTWYIVSEGYEFQPIIWSDKQPSTSIITHTNTELHLYSNDVNQDGKAVFNVARKVKLPQKRNEIILLKR